jgi:hypothetical protein
MRWAEAGNSNGKAFLVGAAGLEERRLYRKETPAFGASRRLRSSYKVSEEFRECVPEQ